MAQTARTPPGRLSPLAEHHNLHCNMKNSHPLQELITIVLLPSFTCKHKRHLESNVSALPLNITITRHRLLGCDLASGGNTRGGKLGGAADGGPGGWSRQPSGGINRYECRLRLPYGPGSTVRIYDNLGRRPRGARA